MQITPNSKKAAYGLSCERIDRDRVEKPKEKKPKLEDTDASSYFGTSNKIKRTAAPPRKPPATKKKVEEDDDFVVDDDDFDFDEEVMEEIETSQPAKGATSTNGTKKGSAKSTPTKASTTPVKQEPKSTPTKRKAYKVESDDEDEFLDPIPAPEPSTRSTPKKSKPAPTAVKKESPPPKKTPTKSAPTGTKAAPPKAAPKTTPKPVKKEQNEDSEGDLQRKAILEKVETVDLPDIVPPSGDTKHARLS